MGGSPRAKCMAWLGNGIVPSSRAGMFGFLARTQKPAGNNFITVISAAKRAFFQKIQQ